DCETCCSCEGGSCTTRLAWSSAPTLEVNGGAEHLAFPSCPGKAYPREEEEYALSSEQVVRPSL
ncbi:hypothetical protein L195_g062302, partial [Trifolium pratense]